MCIALGIAAALLHPSPGWVQTRFTNGYYPQWQHLLFAITRWLPFALGDLVIALGALVIIFTLIRVRPFWRALVGIASLAGVYSLWFYAGWGFGYDRAPLETRTRFDAALLTPQRIAVLRRTIISQMNRLAPVAHDLRARPYEAELRTAWQPVPSRLGNDWSVALSSAKPPLAGWFMDRTGTSGFTNPFTLETQLAPDLLWFERPFAQAHEWAHVAGFNREDEANYVAAIACLRDPDPVARYSGALELFLYLPPLTHYARGTFVPEVWRDFALIRERNAHFVNLSLSRFSWHVYNSYLKSNHIASGVANYNEVTRLFAGIPRDAAGLPIPAMTR